MSQKFYSPLGPNSTRLLRLKPHDDETSEVHCELFEYSIQDSANRTHLYEALSYVWGDPHRKTIYINNIPFGVTLNLYGALLHLRNHALSRVVWIDAICIDQENLKEKEQQIQFMAKIYAQASRVIVWLGKTADDSDIAFEAIQIAADDENTSSVTEQFSEISIFKLLERPWFRRMWVSNRSTITTELIDKFISGASGGRCGSKCPDSVWVRRNGRLRLLLGCKSTESDLQSTSRSARFDPLSDIFDKGVNVPAQEHSLIIKQNLSR